MNSVLSHRDLDPLFIPDKKAKEDDYTPFKIFKAAFSHSAISKYAIAGGMLGWYSGQSFEMGFIGASAGVIKDLIPILYHQLPDDLKELADQTANIGLTTLGTYAIYNSIPDIWVANIFRFVPDCIKHFPTAYANFMNSPISTPLNPRTLEAAAKATMQFLSPLVLGGATFATGSLTALGFGQIRKFSVSAIGSYVGVESLNALGELSALRPFANIVKDFAKNRGKFVSRVIDVAAAISAIPISAYLQSNPIQPLNLVSPDVALPFYKRAVATVLYVGSNAFNTLISPESYARVFIVATLALVHIEFNIKRPPEPKKELPEFEEITPEDVYDLLLISLQGSCTAKAKGESTASNIIDNLQVTLEPIRKQLDRAVKEHHAELQTQYRNRIIELIDETINSLADQIPHLGDKSRLLMGMYQIEACDLKLEELNYKINDPVHRKKTVTANANKADTKRLIKDTLLLKFVRLTQQAKNLYEQYTLVHNRNDGGVAIAQKIVTLINRIDRHRQEIEAAITALES